MIYKKISNSYIGKNIIRFNTIDSTNNKCKEMYRTYPSGTVLISDTQTRGRGKGTRTWVSDEGGIYMSILIKPSKQIQNFLSTVPLLTSIIICETLKSFNIEAFIKWPNDIILNDRKLGGILVESKFNSTSIDYIVIGIGLNINSSLNSVNNIDNIFTSLYDTYNKTFNKEDIINTLLCNFEFHWENFIKNGFNPYLNLYKEYCIILNARVKLIVNDTTEIINVLDVSQDGSLVITTSDHSLKKIYSGDISIRGLNGYI